MGQVRLISSWARHVSAKKERGSFQRDFLLSAARSMTLADGKAREKKKSQVDGEMVLLCIWVWLAVASQH